MEIWAVNGGAGVICFGAIIALITIYQVASDRIIAPQYNAPIQKIWRDAALAMGLSFDPGKRMHHPEIYGRFRGRKISILSKPPDFNRRSGSGFASIIPRSTYVKVYVEDRQKSLFEIRCSTYGIKFPQGEPVYEYSDVMNSPKFWIRSRYFHPVDVIFKSPSIRNALIETDFSLITLYEDHLLMHVNHFFMSEDDFRAALNLAVDLADLID